MNKRRDRLASMVAPHAAATSETTPVVSNGQAAPGRRRALLYAPPPAVPRPYLNLLELEGFDVLLAEDRPTASALLRSSPPELVVALVPALGQEIVDSWRALVPSATIRAVPSFLALLQERFVSPSELLDFTVRSLSVAAGSLGAAHGASRERAGHVLGLAEKAGAALGLRQRDLATVRVAAVLRQIVAATAADDPDERVFDTAAAPPTDSAEPATGEEVHPRREPMAHLAELVGCPLPVAARAPAGPPELRQAVPLEIVDAAEALVGLLEQGVQDTAEALRALIQHSSQRRQTLHPAAVEAVLRASGEGRGTTRATILVADADGAARNLLALRLGNEGYSVRTAADGRAALAAIRSQPPSLVIAETVLPGLDGYALLDSLNQEGKGHVPFIFLSSRADPVSVNKGLLLGATDFLAKPGNFEVLLTKLDKALGLERHALRDRFAALSGELSVLSELPVLGEHLACELQSIFSVRSVTLLLRALDDASLSLLFSTREDLQNRDQALDSIEQDDPGLVHLEQTGAPEFIDGIAERSTALTDRFRALGAELLVPVRSHRLMIGLILLGSKHSGERFRPSELDLLALLARQLATTLENARLFTTATYEALTGLLRREAILERLQREMERAARYRRPISIAMADLDHFKRVNDTYGHLAGDALLKKVAAVLTNSLRSTDKVGRYGGDEFLMVFPETDLPHAYGAAEKIRRLVEEIQMTTRKSAAVRATVSIGLATLEEVGASRPALADELIAAADRQLLEAKRSGRNQVQPARSLSE